MEHLSKHLSTGKVTNQNLDITNQSWQYNPSRDDEYRDKRKIDARKEAILLANRVDRSAINDMLLREKNEFEPTPKYLSVTRRLYQPFPDETLKMATRSTFDQSNLVEKETNDDEDNIGRPSLLTNRHRAVTVQKYKGDTNIQGNFFNTVQCATPSQRKRTQEQD